MVFLSALFFFFNLLILSPPRSSVAFTSDVASVSRHIEQSSVPQTDKGKYVSAEPADFCPVCSPALRRESVFLFFPLVWHTPKPSTFPTVEGVMFQKMLALRESSFEELQALKEK